MDSFISPTQLSAFFVVSWADGSFSFSTQQHNYLRLPGRLLSETLCGCRLCQCFIVGNKLIARRFLTTSSSSMTRIFSIDRRLISRIFSATPPPLDDSKRYYSELYRNGIHQQFTWRSAWTDSMRSADFAGRTLLWAGGLAGWLASRAGEPSTIVATREWNQNFFCFALSRPRIRIRKLIFMFAISMGCKSNARISFHR